MILLKQIKLNLLSGVSYEKACPMKQIDKDTIEFTGSAYSLIEIYDRIIGCPDLIGRVKCSVRREDLIPNFVTNPIDRFIRECGTCMVKDNSTYTIRFKRVFNM